MKQKLYKVYKGKITCAIVVRETKCFYFLDEQIPAFQYLTRIEKNEAMLTPYEAVQEAINDKKTMQGALKDRLAKVETGLKALESLRDSHKEWR